MAREAREAPIVYSFARRETYSVSWLDEKPQKISNSGKAWEIRTLLYIRGSAT